MGPQNSLPLEERFGCSLIMAIRPWEVEVFDAMRRVPNEKKFLSSRLDHGDVLRFARVKGDQVVGRGIVHLEQRLWRVVSHVRRHHDIVSFDKRVVRRNGFVIEDIDSGGPYMTRFQQFNQHGFVEQA